MRVDACLGHRPAGAWASGRIAAWGCSPLVAPIAAPDLPFQVVNLGPYAASLTLPGGLESRVGRPKPCHQSCGDGILGRLDRGQSRRAAPALGDVMNRAWPGGHGEAEIEPDQWLGVARPGGAQVEARDGCLRSLQIGCGGTQFASRPGRSPVAADVSARTRRHLRSSLADRRSGVLRSTRAAAPGSSARRVRRDNRRARISNRLPWATARSNTGRTADTTDPAGSPRANRDRLHGELGVIPHLTGCAPAELARAARAAAYASLVTAGQEVSVGEGRVDLGEEIDGPWPLLALDGGGEQIDGLVDQAGVEQDAALIPHPGARVTATSMPSASVIVARAWGGRRPDNDIPAL